MKKNKFLLLVAAYIFLSFIIFSCKTTSIKNSPSISYIFVGNKFAQEGNFLKSAEQYQLALKKDPISLTAKRNLGLVFVKIGRYKEAIELLNVVSANYQKDSELFYSLGEGYRGIGFYKNAIDCYHRALALTPQYNQALKSLAWAYLKQGNLLACETTIRLVYNKDPLDLQSMLIMSSIYLKKGLYSKSIQTLNEFEKSHFKVVGKDKSLVDTEKILLLSVLGNSYAGIGHCDKAQKIYSIILEIRPWLSSALTDSAKCDLKMNKPVIAKTKLEKAHAASPNYPEALFLLAEIYASTSKKKSLFYYRRFIDATLSQNTKDFSQEILRAKAVLLSTAPK